MTSRHGMSARNPAARCPAASTAHLHIRVPGFGPFADSVAWRTRSVRIGNLINPR